MADIHTLKLGSNEHRIVPSYINPSVESSNDTYKIVAIPYGTGDAHQLTVCQDAINCSINPSTGRIYATGGFEETSDERLKDFGGKIPVDLERLLQLKKNYFMWNNVEDDTVKIGVSAQEIAELYPEIVSADKDGKLSVSYGKLAVVALAAVDELYLKTKSLEDRLNRLEEIVNNRCCYE